MKFSTIRKLTFKIWIVIILITVIASIKNDSKKNEKTDSLAVIDLSIL